ncbi:PucR family transcriptional regulator [Amycolatopsis sp. A1MSW2902]|uniref:PucR family transcriptional regulator n=1 Tax=Amycolatopsis sp. A1MSW2902 TaxID=687413 RepID=UPI003FCCBD42
MRPCSRTPSAPRPWSSPRTPRPCGPGSRSRRSTSTRCPPRSPAHPIRCASRWATPASGLAGFRTTHQQARQAEAVAQMTERTQPRPVTAAAQLGPLALVAADPSAVAGWVQSVLGALADDDEGHHRMRETVWAYLSSGSSLMVAAQELHLHKNTIQYRLRKAEQERGRPLSEGRIDVEVALLACRLLGPAVLRPVD